MFESTGGEVPEEGAAAGAPRPRAAHGGSPESLDNSSPVEPNGVWAERDWTDVPVLPASDDPPPGWQPENGWLDDLEYPQLGPVSWLDQVKPSGRLMCELEELPADLVESDRDAVEMVAHWARLESYCALRKRTAAAALARRSVMADGLAPLKNLGVPTSEPNIAGDELALRLGIGKRAAQTLCAPVGRSTGSASRPLTHWPPARSTRRRRT